MQRIVGVALASTALLCAVAVRAADVAMLNGKVAKLKDKAGTVSDQALVKFTKESAFATLPPSPLCPTTSTVQLTSDTGDVLIPLDCGHWTASGSRYLYLDPTGSSGGVQKIVLVSKPTGGTLLIKMRGAHYGVSALPGQIAFLDARITIDTASYCGRFESPPSVFKKNDPDKVVIKGPSGACVAPPTPTDTPPPADTPTATAADTATVTATPVDTATATATGTHTNTVPPGSTATDTPTPTVTPTFGPPVAFRVDSVALRDPHVYVSFGSCVDATDPPGLGGLSANGLISNQLNADGDSDGFLDFSLLAIFRPLRQPPLSGVTLDILPADCTPPVGMEVCSPGADSPQSTTYANQSAGTCLTPLAGTVGMNNSVPYTPAISSPGAPCFNTTPVTISFPFGVFTVPLQDVRAGATYVGTPATQLTNGLLTGFLSQSDADAIVVPPDVLIIGGHTLSSFLPGGTGSCATHTAKDTGPMGQQGWYFYLNFSAHQVTWTGT